jgi:hypothetical protein
MQLNHKIEEDINYLNKSITIYGIEAITVCQQRKAPRLHGFIAKFYQIFKEEVTPILLKLF